MARPMLDGIQLPLNFIVLVQQQPVLFEFAVSGNSVAVFEEIGSDNVRVSFFAFPRTGIGQTENGVEKRSASATTSCKQDNGIPQ